MRTSQIFSTFDFLMKTRRLRRIIGITLLLPLLLIQNLYAQPLAVTASANPSIICFGSSSQLNATVTGGNGTYTYSWTSTPSGFSSTIRNPIVSPTITTIYTVTVTSGTQTASDDVQVSVSQLPTANAGSDDTICQGNNYQLNGIASYQSTITWNTSGDGYFNNQFIVNPIYFPGANDISMGYVNLSITSQPIAPCLSSVTDVMTLNINRSATANAGSDGTICRNGTYNLSGSATFFSHILWTTAGDGFFDNDTIFTPNYTPGTSDISNGSVILTLSAENISDCPANITDNMLLTLIGFPSVNAGSDATICTNGYYTIPATGSNFSLVRWTTSGDGVFSNDTIITPTYTPGINDLTTGSAILTINVSPISPCPEGTSDEMTLSFADAPTVNAGEDGTTCQNLPFPIVGNAINYSTIDWLSLGDGTFENIHSISTTYMPGPSDITNGFAKLVLKANGVSPCDGYSTDTLTVSIITFAQVEAGEDALICELANQYTLSGIAENSSSTLWISGGDGSFNNPNQLDAIYTLGNEDITNGFVTLYLSALSNTPCNETVTDSLVLSIIRQSVANAGEDAEICEGEEYQLNGQLEHSAFGTWSTNGDGTFNYPDSLNAIYTPGPNDISNGTVTLSLFAWATIPCNTPGQDAMILLINKASLADAGEDQIICQSSNVLLEATASNYESITWTSSGDGTFSNTSILNPLYYPGSTDTTSGSVKLYLTAYAISGCNNITDSLHVIIKAAPLIDAGPAQTIDIGSSTFLEGSVTPSTGTYYIQWEPSSMVSDANILNPETVVLTETTTFYLHITNQQTGCVSNDSVSINVVMGPVQVVVTAEPDTICRGRQVQLLANAQYGTGNYTYYWTSVPAGFSSDIADPVVSPDTTTTYKVIVNDGTTSPSASAKVLVYKGPTSYPIIGPETVKQYDYYNYTTDQTANVVYLWWISNGSIISGQGTNDILVHWGAIGSGDVNVVSIDAMTCYSDTSTLTVLIKATGIDEFDKKYKINIYPNPSEDIQYFNYTIHVSSNVNIGLYNIEGKKLATLVNNSNQMPGKYICKLTGEDFRDKEAIYYLRVQINGDYFSRKIMRVN